MQEAGVPPVSSLTGGTPAG